MVRIQVYLVPIHGQKVLPLYVKEEKILDSSREFGLISLNDGDCVYFTVMLLFCAVHVV